MKKKLIGNTILLLGTILFIEVTLHILVKLPRFELLRKVTYWDSGDEDVRWKMRFSKMYRDLDRKTIPISQNEYKPHPVLGWVPKANLSIINRLDQRYTTNSSGFRSLHEYSQHEDKYTVLVVGDSFTYGSWADDSEVWPTLLQQMDMQLNVLNLAVGGYGTDQMALMLDMRIDEYNPDLVIIAFISDNLHRSTLRFRGYWKPRYVLDKDNLVLTGTPVPELPQGAAQVQSDLEVYSLLNKSRFLGLALNVYTALTNRLSSQPTDEERKLNWLIFENMVNTVQQSSAEILLLYLPVGIELVDGGFTTKGESFLPEFVSSHGVTGLNPRHHFLAKKQTYSKGHYRMAGATGVDNIARL